MLIIDAFPFFNELDVLEFRLTELNDYVDYFILVESTKTFSNKDKILYFNENKERYTKFLDKIIHVIVTDNPTDCDAWSIEKFQRDCLVRGFKKIPNLKESDIIISTDCDEVISTHILKKIRNNEIIIDKPHRLYMHLYKFLIK